MRNRDGFFVYASKTAAGPDYGPGEIAYFSTTDSPIAAGSTPYIRARSFAVASLTDHELVWVYDDQNRTVFFEWRQPK